MSDASITAVYIDHDPDPGSVYISPRAKVGNVQLQLPPRAACHHPVVDFGKPERDAPATHVRVVCLGCAHEWASVKVHERRAQQGEE